MHKDDQMTPRERQKSLANGMPVDRCPIGIIFGSAGKQMFGSVLTKNGTKASAIAELQIKIYEAFGVDGIEVFYGLSTFAGIYGAVMNSPPVGPPAILRHPFGSLDDWAKIEPEKFTVKDEVNARICMDALKIIQERIGDEVVCGMGFPGAFTVASSLLGPERLLRAIYRDPENLHKLLAVLNAALISLASDFLREDIPVSISDPVASGTMIGSKQFGNFVKPYAREFVDACQKIRPYGVGCHICGDTTNILTDLVECGYSSLSLDDKVDLAVAKEKVGGLVPISGNVPPVEIMALGSEAEIEAAVKDCFRKAGDSPCGFTINTGCDCSPLTTIENAFIYMRAARRCAKYPYSEANLDW